MARPSRVTLAHPSAPKVELTGEHRVGTLGNPCPNFDANDCSWLLEASLMSGSGFGKIPTGIGASEARNLTPPELQFRIQRPNLPGPPAKIGGTKWPSDITRLKPSLRLCKA